MSHEHSVFTVDIFEYDFAEFSKGGAHKDMAGAHFYRSLRPCHPHVVHKSVEELKVVDKVPVTAVGEHHCEAVGDQDERAHLPFDVCIFRKVEFENAVFFLVPGLLVKSVDEGHSVAWFFSAKGRSTLFFHSRCLRFFSC